tara:strand:- start:571 stop:948 length:378 start_codon:yes stop_codon:yes gene_type:complete
MQASRRTERINVILRRYISEIISRDMKDPRLASLITIINVTVSKDIRHARVFTSVMGDSNESAQTVETLNSASGFIRQNLMPKLRTKNVPHLKFVLDDSIQKGNHLLGKIDTVINEDSQSEGSSQ